MNNNVQAIDLVAQELALKTVELAQYKVAYQEAYTKLEELQKLEKLINDNKELKDLVEEARKENK